MSPFCIFHQSEWDELLLSAVIVSQVEEGLFPWEAGKKYWNNDIISCILFPAVTESPHENEKRGSPIQFIQGMIQEHWSSSWYRTFSLPKVLWSPDETFLQYLSSHHHIAISVMDFDLGLTISVNYIVWEPSNNQSQPSLYFCFYSYLYLFNNSWASWMIMKCW